MSTKWEIISLSKVRNLKSPILVEGLPGIGNVGKIALDYIVENIGAKRIFEISSNTFPHSVFITEDNLVELPTISVFHKRVKGKDFLFLCGDIQPTDEIASYDFAHFILDHVSGYGTREVVTLGGIALNTVPPKPKVFCTGNDRKYITSFPNVETKLYGVIGPIVGVSGLLLGLASQKKMSAATLLAETLGHPMYLGMEGARAILRILEKRFSMGVDLKGFDKEIKQMENEMRKKALELDEVSKSLRKRKGRSGETSYIG